MDGQLNGEEHCLHRHCHVGHLVLVVSTTNMKIDPHDIFCLFRESIQLAMSSGLGPVRVIVPTQNRTYRLVIVRAQSRGPKPTFWLYVTDGLRGIISARQSTAPGYVGRIQIS